VNYDEYRLEIHRLCHDYLKLWQQSGGHFPDRLPETWRPQYEKFELIVDVIQTRESIINQIDEFKEQILVRREKVLKYLESSFPRKAVLTSVPTRSNMKKKNPEEIKKIIDIAALALAVYGQKNSSRHSVAAAVFGFTNTHSDQASKSAERQVRQYLAHAEMLMNAAGTCVMVAITSRYCNELFF
jgi:hypothetical protein